ncbi:hypothetical protein EH227_02980 [Rouxiella chamberiensis]|nr:hypothetical protein EH227_02980 [Rouxiella chamberiensis]
MHKFCLRRKYCSNKCSKTNLIRV